MQQFLGLSSCNFFPLVPSLYGVVVIFLFSSLLRVAFCFSNPLLLFPMGLALCGYLCFPSYVCHVQPFGSVIIGVWAKTQVEWA